MRTTSLQNGKLGIFFFVYMNDVYWRNYLAFSIEKYYGHKCICHVKVVGFNMVLHFLTFSKPYLKPTLVLDFYKFYNFSNKNIIYGLLMDNTFFFYNLSEKANLSYPI